MLAATTEAATNYAEFDVPAWVWVAFLAGFSNLLLIDVLVIHREPALCIRLGLRFPFVILAWQGAQPAGEYLAGYLIEESLSIDNVFVWALILSYFVVPRTYHHRGP